MDQDNKNKNKDFRPFYKVYTLLPTIIKFEVYKFYRRRLLKKSKVLPKTRIIRVKIDNFHFFRIKHFGGIIEHEIFVHGLFNTWESDLGWLWIELSKISSVIIDIGANKGIYSLVAKCLNPDSQIYCFEPSINTFDKLKFNINLNNYDIVCEKLAVSNKSKDQIYFDLPDENQTTASLSAEKMKFWNGYSGDIIEYPVKTIRLSDYIIEKRLDKVDLIKIDIEMHEPEAFEGMGDSLIELKPIVVFEILNDKVAERLKEFIDLDHFSLYHLKKTKKAVRLFEIKMAENSIANGEWNYLLVPMEKISILRERNLISD